MKFSLFDSLIYIRAGYLGKVSRNVILFKKCREKPVEIFEY